MEAASSGKLVPIATMVRPIISSLTPIDDAIDLALQTVSSAPPRRTDKPMMKLSNACLFEIISSLSDFLLAPEGLDL